MTALVATGGIFVGVLALTLILAVMNGLERELAALIHDGEAHIELRPRTAAAIPRIAPVLAAADACPGVAGSAPFVRSEVLLVHAGPDGHDQMETATLIGISQEREPAVTGILAASHPPFQGFAPDPAWILPVGGGGETGLLLGVELAQNLRLRLGEPFRVVVPEAADAAIQDLDSLQGRQLKARVVGLIDAGLYEYNATRVIGDIGELAAFLRVAGEAQGIGVRCRRPADAPALAESLLARPALSAFEAETWQDRNQVLFEAMAREKLLMYLFLLLTIFVASLGIVGTLTLMISEKRPEIGLLRTLGLPRRGVMGMVVLEGWLVGLAGVLGGLAGAWILGAFLQRHPLRIPWDLFVLETVPILLNPVDFLRVGVLTLTVCLLATLYPGWEAARMDPIQAIRST
jgi:lipoprotein-releasing system permease protein